MYKILGEPIFLEPFTNRPVAAIQNPELSTAAYQLAEVAFRMAAVGTATTSVCEERSEYRS